MSYYLINLLIKLFSSSSSPIFVDKNKIFLDQLIDQCDGSYFELQGRYLSKIDINQAKDLIQTG